MAERLPEKIFFKIKNLLHFWRATKKRGSLKKYLAISKSYKLRVASAPNS